MPFCVGLTGGIGSGKSTVAAMFAECGAAVVDTDAISHELTRPGGQAISAIRDAFGPGHIGPDGSLDRARMRELVFRDPAAKARLEAILHPLIRERSRTSVATATQPYAILAVPLLLETGAYRDLIRRVLVVDCSESRQIERATRRSRLSADEVRAIMASQLPRAERLKRADDVLGNDGGMETLHHQVGELHAKYLELAGKA
jgi:dephospho-CoA kinase